MDQDLTPQVNGETMQNFIGKRVSLSCHLESMNGERVNVKTSDGLDVTVRTTSGKEYGSSYVQVLGTVESPNSIVEDFHTNLGDSYGGSCFLMQIC